MERDMSWILKKRVAEFAKKNKAEQQDALNKIVKKGVINTKKRNELDKDFNFGDKKQVTDLIKTIRQEREEYKNLSENSKKLYLKKFDILERKGHTPAEYCKENNLSYKTYYTYRAAAISMMLQKTNDVKNKLDKAQKEKDKELSSELRKEMKTYAEYLYNAYKETYKGKEPSNQRMKQLELHNTKEKAYIKAKRRQNRSSKRSSLQGLTKDQRKNWMYQVQNNMPEKYKVNSALLHATGARPSEIERGILVKQEGEDIKVKIMGSKYNGKDKGHEWRKITIDGNGIAAKQLKKEIELTTDYINVKLPENTTKESFAIAYKRACIKSFGEKQGKKMSLYSARHQVGSNLKAEGRDHQTIAQVMGHASERSQSHYGSHMAGGNSGILSAESSGPVRSPDRTPGVSGSGPAPR